MADLRRARPKDPARVRAGHKAAERRRENEEFAKAEIPEELHDVFEMKKRSKELTPYKRRAKNLAEAFQEWAHDNAGELELLRADAAEAGDRNLANFQDRCTKAANQMERELQKADFDTNLTLSQFVTDTLSECEREFSEPGWNPLRMETQYRLDQTGVPF